MIIPDKIIQFLEQFPQQEATEALYAITVYMSTKTVPYEDLSQEGIAAFEAARELLDPVIKRREQSRERRQYRKQYEA